ncbi:MAG: hypothetical protein IMF07_01805 [Proteobacteria bacterium]|nr:hypothetical protein [Pseudomonadota bacterium]
MRIVVDRPIFVAIVMGFALFVLSSFQPRVSMAVEIIELHYPLDGELVTKEMGHLVAKVDVSVSPYVSVKVNEQITPVIDMLQPLYTDTLGDMLIVRLYFVPGVNEIEVVGKNADGDEVVKSAFRIFYKPTFASLTSSVPSAFVESPFHVSEREDLCSACHRMKVDSAVDMEPVKKFDIFCTRCHESGLLGAKEHGGTTWKCLFCHDHEAADKYSLYDNKGAFCLDCHGSEMDAFLNMTSVHPKFRERDCLACHGGHVAGEGLLGDAVNILCFKCHQSVYDGTHITPGHPLEAPKDPSREGKGMDCMSCHLAHASQKKALLKFKGGMGMCAICHAK